MIPQKDWVRDLVIYQVYPRSFYDSNGDGVGDLPGVIQKLDYLQQLGVNALWLSPFFASPNDDNGYDISDYRAILPEFGTMEDCEELIRQCHARGMKFIMDLVVNHSSDEHEWFQKSVRREEPYTDYYYWRDPVDGHAPNNWGSVFGGSAWEYNEERGQYYFHFFSKKQPDLNWSNPLVRNEIHDLIRFWKDKGVDGLRVDAISYLDKPADFPDAEGEPSPDGYVFPALLIGREGTHAYIHELNEKLFTPLNLMTVGEVSLVNDEELFHYVSDEHAEFDMAIPFLPPIAEFGVHVPSMLRERLEARYFTVPDGWWAQFMSNHDKPRQVSSFGDDGEFREISAKALALVNHVSPGTPFIYQGEELGMTNVRYDSIDQYDDISTKNDYNQRLLSGDTPEEALRFAAKMSRDNARSPMQWNAEANAGFTTGNPWLTVNPNYSEINAEAQLNNPHSVLNFYRRLIALRKAYPALRDGVLTMVADHHDDVVAFAREAEGETLILAANLSGESRPVPPCLRGEILMQSYESGFDGITLRPWEAVLTRVCFNLNTSHRETPVRKIIPLWPHEAPYTAQSPEQAQPTVTEYKVIGSRGAVVICPGGGYAMKADHEGGPIAEMLNEAGVSAYVLDYRVAPCHHLAPVTDALRAIRLVRSFGYEKVGILGFSAGGNLTCSAATLYNEVIPEGTDPVDKLSARPDAFIPCYPVVDMGDYTHVGSRENLLGKHADDPEYRRKFSAQLNITEDTPPAFLWHTASDGAVPVENSLMLATALSAKNIPFELHIFPEGNHGLGLAEENPIVSQWSRLCQKWLISLGFSQ